MFDTIVVLQRVGLLLDEALAAGFELVDPTDAVETTRMVESVRRKATAVAAGVHGELDRSQVFRTDGHSSATTMSRHVGQLSRAEAAARARGARMVPALPEVAEALAAGALGVAQFELLGRVYANPRVRAAMTDAQGWFLKQAGELSFADFELVVRQWERLVDHDGPEPANSRRHENRTVSLVQDRFDLSWELQGSFGALQGASMADIFEHYVAAERLADWEKAHAEHGEAATRADLARNEPQRRADALWQLFQDATAANSSAVAPDFVHCIVWSAAAYEGMVRRLDGDHCAPIDPDTYRCETIDGVPLEPTEAAATSLVGKLRRVVVDAAGVVIDLGRARCFTGNSRTAVQLSTSHCLWPGCAVPVTHCEIDHTVEHGIGGRTHPGNGGPLCGRHNRHKQKGFTISRDAVGLWHTFRPDGTEID